MTPPSLESAQQCFTWAIQIAQRQKANSLELRAAASLARVQETNSRQQEARQLLAEVYQRFDEGFDTADLREAKALLTG